MGKIEKQRQTIVEILNNYKEILSRRKNPPLESVFVFDEKNDNYTWLKFGWQDGSRFEGIIVFVRIKAGKIHIEEDWTENGFAADLIEKGVSSEDIVLAFQRNKEREIPELALS